MWGRALVLMPANHVMTEEQRAGIERLWRERSSLRGLCRVRGVGLRWLLYFRGDRFAAAPHALSIPPRAGTQQVSRPRLEAEVDARWSFVGRKADRRWGWSAREAVTRHRLAFHVGERSRQSAHAWGDKIPRGEQA